MTVEEVRSRTYGGWRLQSHGRTSLRIIGRWFGSIIVVAAINIACKIIRKTRIEFFNRIRGGAACKRRTYRRCCLCCWWNVRFWLICVLCSGDSIWIHVVMCRIGAATPDCQCQTVCDSHFVRFPAHYRHNRRDSRRHCWQPPDADAVFSHCHLAAIDRLVLDQLNRNRLSNCPNSAASTRSLAFRHVEADAVDASAVDASPMVRWPKRSAPIEGHRCRHDCPICCAAVESHCTEMVNYRRRRSVHCCCTCPISVSDTCRCDAVLGVGSSTAARFEVQALHFQRPKSATKSATYYAAGSIRLDSQWPVCWCRSGRSYCTVDRSCACTYSNCLCRRCLAMAVHSNRWTSCPVLGSTFAILVAPDLCVFSHAEWAGVATRRGHRRQSNPIYCCWTGRPIFLAWFLLRWFSIRPTVSAFSLAISGECSHVNRHCLHSHCE